MSAAKAGMAREAFADEVLAVKVRVTCRLFATPHRNGFECDSIGHSIFRWDELQS